MPHNKNAPAKHRTPRNRPTDEHSLGRLGPRAHAGMVRGKLIAILGDLGGSGHEELALLAGAPGAGPIDAAPDETDAAAVWQAVLASRFNTIH